MPLVTDTRPLALTARAGRPATSVLEIGLINNMSDGALESTERQFSQLLSAAAGTLPVRLSFYTLPEIARGSVARERIETRYRPLDTLRHGALDALIITGAEPRTAELGQEPYWQRLVELLDWAQSNVVSAVCSCLAAHAAVLHLTDIVRRPLAQKCCGVFEHEVDTEHWLTQRLSSPFPTPHSRWNDLDAEALRRGGYDLLAVSPTAGVNLFAKRQGDCHFVFWQGHPEYDDRSLLKEYQRDIARYLSGERDAYPSLPEGSFDAPVVECLRAYEQRARAARDSCPPSDFPFELAAAGLTNRWRAAAVQVYRNWLEWMTVTRGS
jgi:homoserine O-succinyltransferase